MNVNSLSVVHVIALNVYRYYTNAMRLSTHHTCHVYWYYRFSYVSMAVLQDLWIQMWIHLIKETRLWKDFLGMANLHFISKQLPSWFYAILSTLLHISQIGKRLPGLRLVDSNVVSSERRAFRLWHFFLGFAKWRFIQQTAAILTFVHLLYFLLHVSIDLNLCIPAPPPSFWMK